MNLQRLVGKCTQEALTILGEPTMQSLAYHMSGAGVSWILQSISMLLFVAADVGFAYHSATEALENDWMWDPLYNSTHILMAATLFWHNRFFIYDKNAPKNA